MTMPPKRPVYPFAALVGQERLKKALILNAINPRLGGVLIRGEKGTAKSTAARGLAELLPPIPMVAGCPFHCHPEQAELMCDACRERLAQGEVLPGRDRPMPVVDLPLGTTEDRLLGTIDLERAIKSGEKHFEPGLLAAANRGILYVDEVNLLDDHLVDVLLDAAAMGVNVVEREGISFAHPARFILVGTMNPEEGELRPQLLDRFGLCVEVTGLTISTPAWPWWPAPPGLRSGPGRLCRPLASRAGSVRQDILTGPGAAAPGDLLPGSPAAHHRHLPRPGGGRPPGRHLHAQGGPDPGGLRAGCRSEPRRRAGGRRLGACPTGCAANPSATPGWTRTNSRRPSGNSRQNRMLNRCRPDPRPLPEAASASCWRNPLSAR